MTSVTVLSSCHYQGPAKLRDSIRIGRFQFDSKVTGRFEIFESAAPAVVPQTMLIVLQKNFNRCTVVFEIYFMFMILCNIQQEHTHSQHRRSDHAILFEKPRESAHLCSSVIIIITCSRDSIQTKISDSQVPIHYYTSVDFLVTYILQSRFLYTTCYLTCNFFRQISTFYLITCARKHVITKQKCTHHFLSFASKFYTVSVYSCLQHRTQL